MEKLSTAKAGRHTIKWIFGEPEILKLIEKLGIEEESTLSVITPGQKYGGPIIKTAARKYYLTKEVADCITV